LAADTSLPSRRFDVPSGVTVYEETTPAQSVYLIRSGQIRITLHNRRRDERSVHMLEILGPGDWFGTPALTGNKLYNQRATAMEKTTVAEVPISRLYDALSQQPSMSISLIRSLAAKLQTAEANAGSLVFEDINQRIVRNLLELGYSPAAIEQENGVQVRITHQQLAQKIGAARETVSLALNQLKKQNVLRTGRNRLTFERDVLADYYESQSAAGNKEPADSVSQSASDESAPESE